ncbi:hypothetical protein L585_02385 [Pantoea ananatis BRT175]|nr:hypothetical protein L585_02385 [Pantoea ananatis BRT175]CRH32236.1 Uncharacterized protein BN1183_AC_01800 [Pantoea ananatis]
MMLLQLVRFIEQRGSADGVLMGGPAFIEPTSLQLCPKIQI